MCVGFQGLGFRVDFRISGFKCPNSSCVSISCQPGEWDPHVKSMTPQKCRKLWGQVEGWSDQPRSPKIPTENFKNIPETDQAPTSIFSHPEKPLLSRRERRTETESTRCKRRTNRHKPLMPNPKKLNSTSWLRLKLLAQNQVSCCPSSLLSWCGVWFLCVILVLERN